jgi:predicted extracellular nuclease
MMKTPGICLLLLLFFWNSQHPIFGQTEKKAQDSYIHSTIAFWNLENLYDTLNDPDKNDEEFTPNGAKQWTDERYQEKLLHLAEIIDKMGDSDGPEILGVCEIENRQVLEALIATPLLASKQYGIVHFDSPDRRGVDVGLIYKKNFFQPLHAQSITIRDSTDFGFITRDVLSSTGILYNDTITILVNHWSSRRGSGSESKRILAAQVVRNHIDSIVTLHPERKIIVMGDFNDNPNNKSIQEVLNAKAKKKLTEPAMLYNPMAELYKKGVGSLGYQDFWSLFDQMIVSQALLKNENNKFFYMDNSANVYVQKVQVQQEGRFAGYPLRTYSGNTYTGGYSDHFPVYLYLLQQVPNAQNTNP